MREPWRGPHDKELWVASRSCEWPLVNSQQEDGDRGGGLNSVSLKEHPELGNRTQPSQHLDFSL